MLLPYQDSYSKNEFTFDLLTFAGAGAAFIGDVPTGIGQISLAALSAYSISHLTALCKEKNSSSFLRLCAVIGAIGLAALAGPSLIAMLRIHQFAILSFETACKMSVVHFALKVSIYILFRSLLYLRDNIFYTLPGSIQNIKKMDKSSLEKLKTHLTNFPQKEISLAYQISLNEELESQGILPLPLTNFPDIEKEWTHSQLKALHAMDTSHLELPFKIAIAELFYKHDLPPQNRSYHPDEMPAIGTLKKNLSVSKLQWLHLIVKLKPDLSLFASLSRKFYAADLPPPRENAWIDIAIPSKTSEIQSLSNAKIQWIENDVTANPTKWSSLSLSIQKALYERLKKPLQVDASKTVAILSLPHSKFYKEIPLTKTTIFSATAVGLLALSIFYMRYTSKAPADALVGSSLIATIHNSLTVFRKPPKYFFPIIEPTPFPPPTPAPSLPQFLSMEHNVTTIPSTPPMRLDLGVMCLGVIGVAALIFQVLKKRGQSIQIPPAAPTINAIIEEHPKPAPIPSQEDPVAISTISNEVIKEPDWKKFDQYVREHCPNMMNERARFLAQRGYGLYYNFLEGKAIDPTTREDDLCALCWGFMFHAIQKDQPFSEGTFTFKDPDSRIFNHFEPIFYGRLSSHFTENSILHDEGKLQGYKAFGVEVEELPAQKKTVLVGKLPESRIYLKMENWGARFGLDKEALTHLFRHGLDYVAAQSKKVVGKNQGKNTRKEYIPPMDQNRIKDLFVKIQITHPKIQTPKLNKGFNTIVPALSKFQTDPNIPKALQNEISSYLSELKIRYDFLDIRVGDEVIVEDQSNLHVSQVDGNDQIISRFSMVDALDIQIEPMWKISLERLQNPTPLSKTDIISLGQMFQSDTHVFYPDFLIPIKKDITNKAALFKEKIKKPFFRNIDSVFIPILLQNKTYTFFAPKEKIVLLSYQKGIWKYFDPNGGSYAKEEGLVSGFDSPLKTLLSDSKIMISEESHTKWEQNKTLTDPGLAICYYILQTRLQSHKEVAEENLSPDAIRNRLIQYLFPKTKKDVFEKFEFFKETRYQTKKTKRVLEESILPYRKNRSINRAEIFKQIDNDLERGNDVFSEYTLDGKPLTISCAELFTQLKQRTQKSDDEILKIMNLLHQGSLSSITKKIISDLQLEGLDAPLCFRGGQSKSLEKKASEENLKLRKFELQIAEDAEFKDGKLKSEGQIFIRTSGIFELSGSEDLPDLSREKPYAILKGIFEFDSAKDEVTESWNIYEKLIDKKDLKT